MGVVGVPSILTGRTDLDGVAGRARAAYAALTLTYRSRVLTYGPDAARLVLQSFDDLLILLDLVDRGIVVLTWNEEEG